MRLVLEVVRAPAGRWIGEQIEAEAPDAFVIGRSRMRTRFCVGDDAHCSRVHALVMVTEECCRVLDLGSTHGTFVNGRRVREATLQDGDVIGLGPHTQVRARIEVGVRGAGEGAGVAVAVEARGGEDLGPVRIEEPEEVGGGEEELRFRDSSGGGGTAELRFVDIEEAEGAPQRQARVARVQVRCQRCGRMVEATTVAPRAGGGLQVFICEACRRRMEERGEGLPGYRIVRPLGRGGMGSVWLGERLSDGRQVAVKIIIPDVATTRNGLQRFLREVEICRGLEHRHIVGFYEAGEFQGLLYMVTEYVDGGDLDNLRQGRGGRVRPEEAVGIMVQVLEGLEYAHGRGIVHRDLKPGNILLARERGRYVAKIADFGLARARGCQTITGRGEGLGTLAFMAPEQILDARGVDQRADVFGVGATLYNLVTGEFVYDLVGDVERDAARVAAGAVVEVQRRRRNLPQGLVEVINRATRADPGQRYPSAQAMREALARAL